MKTIIVKVNHAEAEHCNFIGINNVPSYLDKKLVVEILSHYTKYDVSTVSELDVICGIHGNDVYYDTASSMENAIKIIKGIKLYTIKEECEWKHEVNCVETIQFRLSDIFNIKMSKDNPWNTFFLVECDKPDVLFNDIRLKEDLHVSIAKSGFYYLPGKWEFNRINEKMMEAKRFREEVICTVVKRTRVEI